MTFAVRDLSVDAYSNAHTLWLYRSATDTRQDIERPGYFAQALDMLADGDYLQLLLEDGAGLAVVWITDETLTIAMIGWTYRPGHEP